MTILFNGLQTSTMTAHPCAAPGVPKNRVFRQAACVLFGILLLSLAACGGGGGGSISVVPPPPPAAVPLAATLNEVQGAGASSPLEDKTVTVTGVVTGDFQNGDADAQNSLNGFFIQEESPDGDPATSDGVFVFDSATSATAVAVGDKVSVEGKVVEFFGETQISATKVSVVGSGSIDPLDIALPLPVTTSSDGSLIADLEPYEGMLVRIPQSLTVVDLFNLERFGEVQLAANGRQFQFTNRSLPDVAGYTQHQQQFASSTLVVDDGLSEQNARPIRFLNPDPVQTPAYSIRNGDTVSGLRGNVRYSRSSGSTGNEVFRILPDTRPPFFATNARDPLPPVVGGTLKVASFNVLNFFTTIDTGQNICGPSGNSGCRGADSANEFDRQRPKILAALSALDADIVGLVELENNVVDALQNLVDGLNSLAGSALWSFVNTGTIGTDAIRVAFIYKTTTVSTVGTFAILDATVDARFLDTRNRPVLLQTFVQISNNGRLNIALGHLKSKGSSCAGIGDPDLADGQGNCNATRKSAAEALADWLATDPTASGDSDFLIVGDLNAYLEEDPLRALEAAGYVNVPKSLLGQDVYSFQFRGESGALDHALASSTLMAQVSGAGEWHINADEPPVLDYNLEFGRDAALFDATSPFRSSDHDPLIIGLALNAN